MALVGVGYPASSYTVQISGVGTASGAVLAEIYDADAGATFNVSARRLVNVSARAPVGTGDGVLFAGFTVTSATGKTLLIRGIGPTLASFGATGVLSDPKLELFDAGATRLQENDDWGGATRIATAASAVGAFALPPGSLDAALVATLPSGSYTVQVSGVGGATGVALVEIYELLETP